MELLNKIYLRVYFLIMLLYVFLNKGVAYTYLVELLLFTGILLIMLNRKSFEIIVEKKFIILLFFIFLSVVYIFFGLNKYALVDVFRDALVFQYACFALIVYMFKNDQEYIWQQLRKIYSWFPIVVTVSFLLLYFVPGADQIFVFGGVPIIWYKNGDKSVHLLISTLLFIQYYRNYTKRWLSLNAILIILNVLILLAFTRSGSLSYFMGLGLFIFFAKGDLLGQTLKPLLKYFPLLLFVVGALFVSLEIQGDTQGRVLGFGQIQDNLSSIVTDDVEGNLTDNKIWRLLWWADIVNYSFTPSYFFTGRGLGMSLSNTVGVRGEFSPLRSPHNFHLTIMARFGVIIFSIWIYWLVVLFKPIFLKTTQNLQLLILCILLTFVVNASFDVFLEGSMGAFPFWTWVGILFISYFSTSNLKT